jgi:hypothetical protein
VIIFEVLGYGGDSQQRDNGQDDDRPKRTEQQGYDPNSAFRAVGSGKLTNEQRSQLTERDRENLDRLVSQAGDR